MSEKSCLFLEHFIKLYQCLVLQVIIIPIIVAPTLASAKKRLFSLYGSYCSVMSSDLKIISYVTENMMSSADVTAEWYDPFGKYGEFVTGKVLIHH